MLFSVRVSWARFSISSRWLCVPAAGEKPDLPFSVCSVVPVPLFNSDLTIPAFAAFIVNAYSSTHRPSLKNKVQKNPHLSRSVAVVPVFSFFVEEVSEVPHAGLGSDRFR